MGPHSSLHSPLPTLPFAVCAGSSTTSSAPRAAWRSPRRSRATPPSSCSSLLPCHRTHPPIHRVMLPCVPPPSSFLRCLSRAPIPPRTLIATSHSLLAPWISPARRTAHTRPAHTESPPLRPTSPHAAWTAATPSFAHGWVARRPCTLTLAPARHSLVGNDLGDDAERALRAAAHSGLRLSL